MSEYIVKAIVEVAVRVTCEKNESPTYKADAQLFNNNFDNRHVVGWRTLGHEVMAVDKGI